MRDGRQAPDPEVGEIDEMVGNERRRMAAEGARPPRSPSFIPWIVALVVVIAVGIVVWAGIGS